MTTDLGRLTAALADRYRVERELGAGGMATVYLAHDLRHDRDVAIKVLHEDLGATLGPERFLAEIKTTAKLQHPHILPLLDSGNVGGLLFYVMPYVEGETLRTRLQRETQLPIDDAVRIAREVADALGFAHGHGIVHRDIKPENILLQGGHALVADFGIALAVQQAGGTRLTQTGLSLGTPSYMSPEQAMGDRTVDQRSDIYALGAVTYEMLTGDPPFTGSSVQAVVAKVLSERPTPLSMIRDTVPEPVEAAVLKALAKLPADRWGEASEYARALHVTADVRAPVPVVATAKRSGFGTPARRIAFAALGISGVAFGAWQWARNSRVSADDFPELRFAVQPPAGYTLALEPPSFDARGLLMAFVAESAATRMVALRRLDATRSVLVPGTQGVELGAVLSRDGSTVYFQQAGQLMRVATDGNQPPSPVTGAPPLSTLRGRGFDALDDGTLLLSPDLVAGVLRFDPATQRIDTLRRPDNDRGEYGVLNPTVVPGGRAYLFSLLRRDGIVLMARTMDGALETEVVQGGTAASFGSADMLLYAKGPDLFVTDFDDATLRVRGVAVPLAQGLPANAVAGSYTPYFSSATGPLIAFITGPRSSEGNSFVLLDRVSGRRTALQDSIGIRPRFSPDGKVILAEDGAHLWLHDMTRGGLRVRFSQLPLNYVTAFTPDGARIVTSTYEGGPAQLWSYSVADPLDAQRLTTSALRRYVGGYTPDGRMLAFVEMSAGGSDILARLEDGTIVPLVQTAKTEHHPRFSPDGRLLAFASDETGRLEVYVQEVPATARPVRISTEGGNAPVWAPQGNRLFFQLGEKLYSVAIAREGGRMSVGIPRLELEIAGLTPPDAYGWSYDISPDGKTLVVSLTEVMRGAKELHVIARRLPR